MSAKPRPSESTHRDPLPAEPPEQRIRRLIAEGYILAPQDPVAGPLAEILTPGPVCPGAVQAVVDCR